MHSRSRELVRKIRLKTRRKLNTLFAGEYHSAFRGYGLLFESVREYQYGDDIRNIDWNVSARMNHLFIKQYVEERELSIVLMIDCSNSLIFGSSRSKRDVILEIAALLLYLAQVNNDRVSVLLFTDRVERFIVPRKGRRFIMSVLEELQGFIPEGKGTDISAAVDFIRRVIKKRSVVFVISDFLDQGYLSRFRLLKKKHDLIPVHVSDPLEKETHVSGLAEFVDLETGETVLTEVFPGRLSRPDTGDFDIISLETVAPIEVPVLNFFKKRNRMRHSHIS